MLATVGCRPRVPRPVGPLARFTDLRDGTVRDNATSLVWTKSGNPAAVAGPFAGLTWREALAFVADMNAGTRPSFGHTDWRLPRVEELIALVSAFWVRGSRFACFNDQLGPGCRFRVPFAPFTTVAERGYWSGTAATAVRWGDGRGAYLESGAAAAPDEPDAWAADTGAYPFPVTKTARQLVWPVRGTATAVGTYRDPTAPPAASPTPIILIPPPVVVP